MWISPELICSNSFSLKGMQQKILNLSMMNPRQTVDASPATVPNVSRGIMCPMGISQGCLLWRYLKIMRMYFLVSCDTSILIRTVFVCTCPACVPRGAQALNPFPTRQLEGWGILLKAVNFSFSVLAQTCFTLV